MCLLRAGLFGQRRGGAFRSTRSSPAPRSLGQPAMNQPSCQDLNQDEKAIKPQTPGHSSREKLRSEQQKDCKRVLLGCRGYNQPQRRRVTASPRNPSAWSPRHSSKAASPPQTITSPPAAHSAGQAVFLAGALSPCTSSTSLTRLPPWHPNVHFFSCRRYFKDMNNRG